MDLKLTHPIHTLFTIAALVLPAVASSQTAVASGKGGNPVVGQWKGETVSAGALAEVSYNFYPNGTYARKIVFVTEYGWTVEGDILLMAPIAATSDSGPSYGKASTVRLAYHGHDSLVVTAGREKMHLRRVTALVPESPLLGRWEGMSDMNEVVTQDFTVDGRLIVSVIVSRAAGRFTTDGEVIVWSEQIPVPKRTTTRYRMIDGKLTLIINPNLPPLELRRIDESIAEAR